MLKLPKDTFANFVDHQMRWFETRYFDRQRCVNADEPAGKAYDLAKAEFAVMAGRFVVVEPRISQERKAFFRRCGDLGLENEGVHLFYNDDLDVSAAFQDIYADVALAVKIGLKVQRGIAHSKSGDRDAAESFGQ